jgi:hypothetical protein
MQLIAVNGSLMRWRGANRKFDELVDSKFQILSWTPIHANDDRVVELFAGLFLNAFCGPDMQANSSR